MSGCISFDCYCISLTGYEAFITSCARNIDLRALSLNWGNPSTIFNNLFHQSCKFLSSSSVINRGSIPKTILYGDSPVELFTVVLCAYKAGSTNLSHSADSSASFTNESHKVLLNRSTNPLACGL